MSDLFAQKLLLRTRRIMLFGDIDDDIAKSCIQTLKYLVSKNQSPIYIYINSIGGDTDASMPIIDEMKLCQDLGVDVYTIAVGRAASCAADILSLGTPKCRFAYPSSYIMMHAPSLELEKSDIGKQKGATEFFERYLEGLDKAVADACGKTSAAKYKTFRADLDKTVWFTAQEAKKYGIIDGIWTANMEKQVQGKLQHEV